MSFVVAFNGARDGYQVPLALHEKGLLSKLVTDLYLPRNLSIASQFVPGLEKLKNRHILGLPFGKVKSNYKLIKSQYLDPILSKSRLFPQKFIQSVDNQSCLSLAAIETAYITNSNLFLYAGYAYEAFRSPLSKGKIKGVFQYHPHIDLSAKILEEDLRCYPQLQSSLNRLNEDKKDITNAYEVSEADFIVCASKFTARSLEYIGVSPLKIHVIPYGIDILNSDTITDTSINKDDTIHFVFVGSGNHRKGLHHLFEAWSKLNLPNAKLTVVARSIEPEIAKLKPYGVDLLSAQSHIQLSRIYDRSHIFVMPSLVEGFGYVYLEALSRGCYCIGTENTGLPDIGCPEYAGRLAIAGNIDSLCNSLLTTYRLFKNQSINRLEIQQFAKTKGWNNFRNSVAKVCHQAENT